MARLLEIFAEGSTYDDALEQALGVDTWGLDNAWRQSIGAPTLVTPALAGVGPTDDQSAVAPPSGTSEMATRDPSPEPSAVPSEAERALPCLGGCMTGMTVLALFALLHLR